MRGRKPKSLALKLLQGNPGKRPLSPLGLSLKEFQRNLRISMRMRLRNGIGLPTRSQAFCRPLPEERYLSRAIPTPNLWPPSVSSKKKETHTRHRERAASWFANVLKSGCVKRPGARIS